ncbi:MAG: FkbM family methyltransferase [Polyangiaceae bacterium]
MERRLGTKIALKLVGAVPVRWIKVVSKLQWRHPLAKKGFDFVADRFRQHDGTIQQGAGKGLRFNVGGSTAGMILGTTEPELQRALASLLQPGMCFYDVGANVGFFSVIAARLVGDRGKVVAFDPLPSNVAAVSRNAQLNGFAHVDVKELAVGRADERQAFIISSDPNWGRLATVGVPDAVIGEQQVEVRRLDQLVADGLRPPTVVKIDVEGAEIDVLEGARQVLDQARPILFIDLHGTNARIAELLSGSRYVARAFGKRDDLLTAVPWDAQVAAIPEERTDLAWLLDDVALMSS